MVQEDLPFPPPVSRAPCPDPACTLALVASMRRFWLQVVQLFAGENLNSLETTATGNCRSRWKMLSFWMSLHSITSIIIGMHFEREIAFQCSKGIYVPLFLLVRPWLHTSLWADPVLSVNVKYFQAHRYCVISALRHRTEELYLGFPEAPWV